MLFGDQGQSDGSALSENVSASGTSCVLLSLLCLKLISLYVITGPYVFYPQMFQGQGCRKDLNHDIMHYGSGTFQPCMNYSLCPGPGALFQQQQQGIEKTNNIHLLFETLW